MRQAYSQNMEEYNTKLRNKTETAGTKWGFSVRQIVFSSTRSGVESITSASAMDVTMDIRIAALPGWQELHLNYHNFGMIMYR